MLFIDFDNTISRGDVLDALIETFSPNEQWKQWQTEWRENRISTFECLTLQVGGMEVDEDTLLEYLQRVPIDPDFVHIQEWAASTATELIVVSDNFDIIVRDILTRHAVVLPPIFANALTFEGKRVIPSFPYRSPNCVRCAHCKAIHYARYPGYRTLYIGDGLSDTCPAMRADRVFAKDSLAAYLLAQGKPFTPFGSLADVLTVLSADEPGRSGAPRS